MRVAVTGGSGFIGTNVLTHLLDSGIPVESWDTAMPRNIAHVESHRNVDVTNPDAIRAALERFSPSHVLHLAARTDLRGGRDDYLVNIAGTRNVLDASIRTDSVGRVIVASSRLVCRLGYIPTSDDDYAPDSHYGASKVEMERVVRTYRDVSWTIVRPTSIWGPWFGTPYRDFFLAVARRRYIHPRNMRIPKSFGYVQNHVQQLLALCLASGDQVDGRTFYAGDPEPIDVLEFARKIAHGTGAEPVRSVPLVALRVLARLGELIQLGGAEPPLTRFRLNNLITPMVYDISPIIDLAGPPLVDTDAGIDATIRWLRARQLL